MGLIKKTTFKKESLTGNYWKILATHNYIGKHTEIVLALYKDKEASEENPEVSSEQEIEAF